MATPYLGQLSLVAFSYPPRGFALCNGQLMSIQQNQALFAVIGTTYGGNGVQTFALPNLQSRIALSSSSNYPLGASGGFEGIVLNVNELPAHNHLLTVSTSKNQVAQLTGNTVGPATGTIAPYSTTASSTMLPAAITSVGTGQSHENRSPFLVLNWIIALQGIFPSRE